MIFSDSIFNLLALLQHCAKVHVMQQNEFHQFPQKMEKSRIAW